MPMYVLHKFFEKMNSGVKEDRTPACEDDEKAVYAKVDVLYDGRSILCYAIPQRKWIGEKQHYPWGLLSKFVPVSSGETVNTKNKSGDQAPKEMVAWWKCH